MKTYPLLQSQLGVFMEWMKDPSVTQYNLCKRVLNASARNVARCVRALSWLMESLVSMLTTR